MSDQTRLEDLFNVAPSDNSELSDLKKALAAVPTTEESALVEENAEVAVNIINEREHRVNQMIDLQKYDEDIDTIYNEALDAFRSAFGAANDLPGKASSEMMAAANGFIKTALDARNSKLKARLDTISLALKKQALDSKKPEESDNSIDGKGVFLDRNQILAGLGDILKKQNAEISNK